MVDLWPFISHQHHILRWYPRLMDFELDEDVNGEILSNSIDAIGRINDENGIGGSSVEGDFEPDHDDKTFQDLSGIPLGIPVTVTGSGSADEPYIGQEFDSEAEAHAYYNAYATRVGFVIRVSKLSRSRRDGCAIGRALVCNKEGYRMPDKREKIVRQRAETRVGCRAMVLVRKVSSGKWVITKFVVEHTHPLSPGKGRRDLIYDQYPVIIACLKKAALPALRRSIMICTLIWNHIGNQIADAACE